MDSVSFVGALNAAYKNLRRLYLHTKNGQIPKENIDCARYREFPEDVSKIQRALEHITTTIKTINEEKVSC